MEIKIDLPKDSGNVVAKKNMSIASTGLLKTIGKKDFSFGVFTDSVKESFFHDLFVLMDSGMDIRVSLELVGSEHKKLGVRKIIQQIEKDIISGMKLSDALTENKEFSTYECVNIRIGEETGKLQEVFLELSKFFNAKLTLKRQIISIISYPLFILLVTLVIVWFMLSVVVPMFTDVFGKLNGELPELTKTVVQMSDFIRNYVAYIIVAIGVLYGVIWSQKNKSWYQRLSSIIILKIPVIGTLVKKVHLNRFSLSMKMMLNSETPVLNSVELIRNMVSFYPLSVALEEVTDNLINGKYLYEGLANHDFFPKRYVTLVRVGEEVNQLGEMFDKISIQLNDEIEYQTQILGKVLEPVMIIFIGVFVGFILISMYLPLFELSTTIN